MRWAVRIALAAEFHAEPFAALCLVAGGRLLRDRGGRAGRPVRALGVLRGPDPAWALDMTVPRQVWLAVVLSVGWSAGGRTAPGRIIVL